LVVVAVGVIIFFLMHKKTVSTPTQDQSGNPVSVVVPDEMAGGASGQFARITSNAIYLVEQKPGEDIYINVLNMDNPGFVIITKAENTNAENIIGLSTWLVAGDSSGISISTTEDTTDGANYYAWLVKDDGDGIFEPKQDEIVMSLNKPSTPVMTEFTVSKDAKDPKSVQINF
jgi:hypothetical protein